MNSSHLQKIVFKALIAITLIALIVFGSLGIAVETCNVDSWFKANDFLLGAHPMRVVRDVWVALVVASLATLVVGIKATGSNRRYIIAWSAANLIILIFVRSIELGQDC